MTEPRILVTGFNAFPGAPLNSTEVLIGELAARVAELADCGEVATAVLDVDYRTLPSQLERLGTPDIAIHFGLSARATGFTLERFARNAFGGKPDNAGHVPTDRHICRGPETLPSALPLGRIHAELSGRGLPVVWSDDAGDYLCNYAFYVSRSPAFPDFTPAMSGFIHVPPLAGSADAAMAITLDDLVEGGIAIVRLCSRAWRGA